MTAPSDTDPFDAPGWPVEIGSIDQELGRLWEESGDSKTRASLMNLVVFTTDRTTVAANTEIIASLAGEHACRALLVLAEPQIETESARAWISAHCQASGKEGRQICSEQITFHLAGNATEGMVNLVFSHLDSDLPLVLWWQAPPPATTETRLWRWVDRLLYDSAEWSDPGPAFDRMNQVASCREEEGGGCRTALCDLNWTRLLGARFAFASFFDHEAARQQIPHLQRLHLLHPAGGRTAALLFLGWIAAQLDWQLEPLLGAVRFVSSTGQEIEVEIAAHDEECRVLDCELSSAQACFRLSRAPDACHYLLETRGKGLPEGSRVAGLEKDTPADLLRAELARAGSHPGYFRALDIIRPLL